MDVAVLGTGAIGSGMAVLDAVAARVTWVGRAPGPASRVKLACNAWVASLNAAMSQAVGLAAGLGVDPRHFFTVVEGTAADSPYLGYKKEIALGCDDTVITPVDAIRKDIALAGAAARDAALPTGFVDALDDLYARLSTSGAGARDMARLAAALTQVGTTPPLRGIHHVKLPVSDLPRSVEFYTAVFGAERLREADHVDDDGRLYAVILRVPGLDFLVELRLDPEQARAAAGFDPLTLAVDDRAALAVWRTRLDDLGVAHSGEIAALRAWLTVLADPDGTRLRLYTLEQHGPEIPAAVGDPWVAR